MVDLGCWLGKDAFITAKAFDDSHHVSSMATAKVAELSYKIGFTDTIASGMKFFKMWMRSIMLHISPNLLQQLRG